MKRNATVRDGLNFSDVLLVPAESNVKPAEVSLKTRVTKTVEIGIPFISAGTDTVTESGMAIALAHLGGLGIIHDNMPLGKQVEEVRRVKRAEGLMVQNPITLSPESSVAEAMDLMATYKISGLPVVEQPSQKVVGILTARDLLFFEDFAKPVSELMTRDVITVKAGIERAHAMQLMHEHRIEKLVVVDDQGRCTGILTAKDFQKLSKYKDAARDAQGRLRVGAAVSLGKDAFDRCAAMTDAGLDVVFVDLAHAHGKEAAQTVSRIRQQRSAEVQIVAGNVATADGARTLIDAGADAIKVGFSGTRGTAARLGFGVPQFTSIMQIAEHCEMADIPVIIDGGFTDAATLIKAFALGAETAVLSCLLAGTDEAPGEVLFHEGQAYKVVNPAAKAQRRPTFNAAHPDPHKQNEDAIDTTVPYRGKVETVIAHLVQELKAAMAFAGAKDLRTLRETAEFVRARQ